MNILIELAIILSLAGGLILFGVHKGKQEVLQADAKEVSAAHDREKKAIEELTHVKLQRDSETSRTITVVKSVKDTTGCLDLELSGPYPDVVHGVRDSLNR